MAHRKKNELSKVNTKETLTFSSKSNKLTISKIVLGLPRKYGSFPLP